MDIQAENHGRTTVVCVVGSVDGMTADSFTSALQSQIEQGNIELVADLSGVTYMSSAGLRALLATVKHARQCGGDFRLASVLPAVLRVLDMSGFTSILKLYGDVDTAVSSYTG